MNLVQNLKNLEEQIKINHKFLNLYKNRQSISIKGYKIEDQEDVLQYLILDGTLEVSIKIPEKTTESPVAYFSLQKGVFTLNLAHMELPSLRKSSKRETGLEYLAKNYVQSIMSEPSAELKYENKTLLAYVLLNEVNLKEVVICNGTWNKESHPLPEKYSSWDKIKPLIPTDQWIRRIKE